MRIYQGRSNETVKRISRKCSRFGSTGKEKGEETVKTTNKRARQNVRQCILGHFEPCGYDFTGPCTLQNVAQFILEVLGSEKYYSPEYQVAKSFTSEAVFMGWYRNLPSVLDICYYYSHSAVIGLGSILEQSERERAQYTEEQAERLLTRLVYRELVKGAAGR